MFSANQLFHKIARNPDFTAKLAQMCKMHGFDELRALLFIRNPVPHAESAYQQSVKRVQGSRDLTKAYRTYKLPELTLQVMKALGTLPNCTVTVFNYDNHKDHLIDLLTSDLEVPAGTIPDHNNAVINRSMTAAELEFLRVIGDQSRPLAVAMGIALCEALPDIVPERMYPSRPVQRRMLERLAPSISAVNVRIPESEAYSTKMQKPFPPDCKFEITSEQIEVIGNTLGLGVSGVTDRDTITGRLKGLFGPKN